MGLIPRTGYIIEVKNFNDTEKNYRDNKTQCHLKCKKFTENLSEHLGRIQLDSLKMMLSCARLSPFKRLTGKVAWLHIINFLSQPKGQTKRHSPTP
jgi:hypothetical protein